MTDLGVFLPIMNNGWIASTNAPQYQPTFALNRDIAQLAERIGFDFALTQSKWKGFGGETKFWDYTLESFTLMAGLAAATSSLKLFASVNALLYPPAVAAKIAVTIDEISQGRFGMNIVAGALFDEYAQMGLVPEGYAGFRYDYAEEWLHVVKRLWTEDEVTHDGRFFHLDRCVSDPKPVQQPRPPVVCAGTSGRGAQFTAAECDATFISANSNDDLAAMSRRTKGLARDLGRELKSYTGLLIIQGETDADAEAYVQRLADGADVEALQSMTSRYGQDETGRGAQTIVERAQRTVFHTRAVVGSPDTVADALAAIIVDCEIDGILFNFPDFMIGLDGFARDIAPRLVERGVLRPDQVTVPA